MPTCEAGGSATLDGVTPLSCSFAVSELRSPDTRRALVGKPPQRHIRCPATTRIGHPASWAYPFFTMSSIPLPRWQRNPCLFELGRIARSGGARRDRTDDLLLAKQALSQLSYGPVQAAG